ncbi:MAG: hypothetical protein CM1200mP15_03670 [Dehalococcoidia bacterium]|nr:MAG: hypothetical protein CM1200mP15_03670 [Dehalococcoidia bacterium]
MPNGKTAVLWGRHEFENFAAKHNVVLVRAMEADTDLGPHAGVWY